MPRATVHRFPTSPRLSEERASFERHLKAGNKSPKTVASYLDAIDTLSRWLEASGRDADPRVDAISTDDLRAFMADQLERLSPGTARNRYASLSVFFRWWVAEYEDADLDNPMSRVVRPADPNANEPPPMLSDREIDALLAEVGRKLPPSRKEGEAEARFRQRRDYAIVKLLLNTGLRLAELAGLKLEDLDLDASMLTVVRKGGRHAALPFGAETAQALDRYLKLRRGHRLARSTWLWIGRHGRFTAGGIADMIESRGKAAGIADLHPHTLRHTWTHDRKRKGVSDGDLMELGGWRDRTMLDRYGKAGARARAIEAGRAVEEL